MISPSSIGTLEIIVSVFPVLSLASQATQSSISTGLANHPHSHIMACSLSAQNTSPPST